MLAVLLLALAQQPDTAVFLPPLEVSVSILRRLGPAVGSGIAGRSSLVPGSTIAAWRPRILPDALARESGVSAYDDLGSPSKFTLVSRGFTSSPVTGLPQGLSVFLDGVPINEADAGQVNFDLIPLADLDRIEFLRGTASLLGPYSLGGAINLITRDGNAPGGEATLAAGSERTWAASLRQAGTAGAYRYYLGGSWLDSEGWRQLTASRQLNAIANLSRAWARSGLRLQVLAANGYAETAGSLPESVYQVRPDSNLTAGDFEDVTQAHLALSGYTAAGAGRVNGTLWLRWSDAERFNVNQQNDPDVRSFATNRTVGASFDWESPGKERGLRLRAGAGGSATNSEISIFAERVDPGLTTDVGSPIGRLDAFAMGDLSLGRFVISGGLRLDAVRIPFHNRLNPARDTSSTYFHLGPRLGATLSIGTGLTAYASLGQGFRPPALVELACADPEEPCPLPFALGDDPPLDPVIATTFELGGELTRGVARLAGSVYRTEVRDEIMLLPYEDEDEPEGSTIDGYFANMAATRREGVELGLDLSLGAVTVRASQAWTRATFRDHAEIFSIRAEAGGENDVEPGDRMPLIPDQVTSLGATWSPTTRWSLGAEAKRTGRAFLRGDEANEEAPLDPWWMVNARAAVTLGPWEARLNVTNLLDASYATFGTFNINQGGGGQVERFLTPGAPRGVQVTLTRRLGR